MAVLLERHQNPSDAKIILCNLNLSHLQFSRLLRVLFYFYYRAKPKHQRHLFQFRQWRGVGGEGRSIWMVSRWLSRRGGLEGKGLRKHSCPGYMPTPLAHVHARSYPTLCNSMDCSPPGSSVHGILQARILQQVAVSFSRGSSWPRDRISISCIGRWILYHRATREGPPMSPNLSKIVSSCGFSVSNFSSL